MTDKDNLIQQVRQDDDCLYNTETRRFECRTVDKIYTVNENGTRKLTDSKPSHVLFTLHVCREKSVISKRERMRVTAYEGDTECGEVVATIPTLQEDLLKLREYGVVLPRSAYGTIAKAIENYYRDLECKAVEFAEDVSITKISKIFAMCCDYIIGNGIEPQEIKKRKCYNIPAVDFTDVVSNSEFRDLDIVEVKRLLLDGGYIRANAGRYDRNVKGTKHISFDGDKVDEQMQKEQED